MPYRKPITFKVYPENRHPEYFTVYIFRSKPAMLAWVRANNKEIGLRWDRVKFEGLTRHWTRYSVKRGRKMLYPDMGAVVFHRGYFGAGVVAHELTHAAIAAARRFHLSASAVFAGLGRNEKDESKENERFCEFVGSMNRQFWFKFYRADRRAYRKQQEKAKRKFL